MLHPTPWGSIAWTALALLPALAGGGCAGRPVADAPSLDLDRRMASMGLERLSEKEACLPPPERGRYVPCRVIPGSRNPVLPEHPAGYLIVRVEGRPSATAGEIRKALLHAEPGGTLKLVVRRNPYLDAVPEWWETTVTVWVPGP